MKNKIKEVQNYFRDKIVSGDYEVIEIDRHYIICKIDLSYTFKLWDCNGVDSFKTWNGIGGNFMDVDFRISDKKEGFAKTKKLRDVHYNAVLRKEREEKFQELKKELGYECKKTKK